MKKITIGLIIFITTLFASNPIWATDVAGHVSKILVGRKGIGVYVDMDSPLPANGCTVHPQGFDYYFSLNEPGADQRLSALLTAYAAKTRIQIVGGGPCIGDDNLEQLGYVVLLEH